MSETYSFDTSMKLGWVDYSQSERKKIEVLLDALSEKYTVDEIGISSIRDGFSNLLFPGFSVQMTRAKYFVVVPYLFMEAQKHSFSNWREIIPWINMQEKYLVKVFISHSNMPKNSGIIGSKNPEKDLVLKPSNIYWSGLKTIGILRRPSASMNDVCREIFKSKQQDLETDLYTGSEDPDDYSGKDDSDSLHGRDPIFLPLNPDSKQWMDNATIDLSLKEADYLYNSFISSERLAGSLTIYLLNHPDKKTNLFLELDTSDMEDALAHIVSLAKDFSEFIYGAHVLYNAIYTEGHPEHDEWINEFNSWRSNIYHPIDLNEICSITRAHPLSVKRFVTEFDSCVSSSVFSYEKSKQLLIAREKQVKGSARAKLCKNNNYDSPGKRGHLEYRYPTACQIISDIKEGRAKKS